MELTEQEIKNCEIFNRTKKYQVNKTERVSKIIAMFLAGKQQKEIKKEVGGDTTIVSETLMKARRRGII
jgi:hypothetical protein